MLDTPAVLPYPLVLVPMTKYEYFEVPQIFIKSHCTGPEGI